MCVVCVLLVAVLCLRTACPSHLGLFLLRTLLIAGSATCWTCASWVPTAALVRELSRLARVFACSAFGMVGWAGGVVLAAAGVAAVYVVSSLLVEKLVLMAFDWTKDARSASSSSGAWTSSSSGPTSSSTTGTASTTTGSTSSSCSTSSSLGSPTLSASSAARASLELEKGFVLCFRALIDEPQWADTEFDGKAPRWSGFLSASPSERVRFVWKMGKCDP